MFFRRCVSRKGFECYERAGLSVSLYYPMDDHRFGVLNAHGVHRKSGLPRFQMGWVKTDDQVDAGQRFQRRLLVRPVDNPLVDAPSVYSRRTGGRETNFIIAKSDFH
jgi:hypothetical protein